MAINVADVITQFGAFYKPGSDNQRNLRNMLYASKETSMYFQDRPTEDTIWRGTLASMNRVVQPFQKAYTPIGTITFKPNQFDLFKLKIDLQETPDDLEATYLGFLAALPVVERASWPFVRWFLENHVMPKKNEDLELNEYYKGVYAAPTPGTAGAVSTAMNGVRRVIRAYNTAGRTNLGTGAIATGAPNADDAVFVGQIEAFVESIPELFRGKIDYIFMSKSLVTKYRRGKRAKYGSLQNYLTGTGVDNLLTIEDYPTIQVKGLLSQSASNLIWTSIPENRIRPVKKGALENTMLVKEFAPRTVSAYTDWWEALNFEVPEFIFHNDQDLV
jgi:hypothetical protein